MGVPLPKNIQNFKILRVSLTTNLDTAGQPFTFSVLSPYRGSSEALTCRVQICCKGALKDFKILENFRIFLAMNTGWALKLCQIKVNLSVWPSTEFERD